EKAAEKGAVAASRNLAMIFTDGAGVPRSLATAARYLLAAARGGDADARQDLDGDMSFWGVGVRRAVQELLTASGDYSGVIDGAWGSASREAAKAYYSRQS